MAEETNIQTETNEEKGNNIIIDFFKSAIMPKGYEKNGRKMSVIAFPKFSIYAGYVWHYPTDWIKQSKFGEDKRFISIKPDAKIIITKSVQNQETKQWEKVDSIELTADRVREAMRKQPKAETTDEKGETNNG